MFLHLFCSFKPDPSQRPSAEELLKNPILASKVERELLKERKHTEELTAALVGDNLLDAFHDVLL